MLTKTVLALTFFVALSAHAQFKTVLIAMNDVIEIAPNQTSLPLTNGSNFSDRPEAMITCTLKFAATPGLTRYIRKNMTFLVEVTKVEDINLENCSVATLKDEFYRRYGKELPMSLDTREKVLQYISDNFAVSGVKGVIHRYTYSAKTTASESTIECEKMNGPRQSSRDNLIAISTSGALSLSTDF